MKRILALLTAIVLTIGLVTAVASAEGGETEDVPFETRHPQAIEIWKTIEQVEREQITKSGASYAEAAEAIYAVVTASPLTKPGSIERHGDAFFWDTVDGAACGYNPTFRARVNRMKSGALSGSKAEAPAVSTKGSIADSRNVAVFQPYYGIDSSFTAQYAEEGASIASALGGTCAEYQASEATINAIAKAMESCAVVIFDSHGCTDYEIGDDCVSRANTSYLCLQSNSGITSADMQYVQGVYGRYKHAYYGGSDGSMKFYMVDGTAIANHMSKNAPDSLLWMAICLGMATDGLHAPLRDRGVQTVYGYSQSVYFEGDYAYEESFFYAMKQGATVTSAISFMKRECGSWDPAVSATSITQAIRQYAAFPIVVSDEDAYPGQGNVDALQPVTGKGRIKETGFVYGDVNSDGRVGVTDASLLLRYAAKSASLSRDQMLRADVNADCSVNAQDASELLRRVVAQIGKFPVEP